MQMSWCRRCRRVVDLKGPFVSGKVSKIGEYRIEIGKVRCGLGFYCYTQSLNQMNSIVAHAQEAVSYNNNRFAVWNLWLWFTPQEISMLYYDVGKIVPGHYKSHALRDPKEELVFTGFLKEKQMSSQPRGFWLLFLSEFFQIILQKASLYWLVRPKKIYFNSIFYQSHAILWEK